MQPSGITFTVALAGQSVYIELYDFKKTVLYKASFPNGSMVVLTKGKLPDGDYFWTSLPEGKQDLAEKIGPLIDAHLAQSKQKESIESKKPLPPQQSSLF